MSNKKPIIFLVLKILAGVFLCVFIVGIVLMATRFSYNHLMTGAFLTSFGMIFVPCAAIGFMPEMRKISVKTEKYFQQLNKEDMTDIANTNAEIQSNAIKTIASSVKEVFSGEEETKFCKHCGALIDEDSRFCKECGKEQ